MKYVTISLTLFFLLGVFASAQESTTTGEMTGIDQKEIPSKIIASTNASVPNKISYQGILTSSGGVPVPDGVYEIKFELFNVVTGGSVLWSETQPAVTVTNGTFSVLLGSVNPLTGIFYQPLWVEITVVSGPGIGSPIVLSPRTELASAAYSLGPWSSRGDSIWVPGYKQVGINTSSPLFPLDVVQFASPTVAKFGSIDPLYLIQNKPQIGFNIYFSYGFRYGSTNNGGATIAYDQNLKNELTFNTAPDGDADQLAPLTTRMTITENGNVGIGTLNPSQLLDVAGSAHIRDTLKVGASARIDNFSTRGGQLQIFDDLGYSYVQIRPTGWGDGGGIRLYHDESNLAIEAWGNAYGQKEAYVGLYGKNRNIIFETRFAGNNSVQLPDSSISSQEMFNEPGVANSLSSSGFLLPKNYNVTNILSATINVPAAGYIVAQAHAIGQLSGDTLGNIFLGVETSPTTLPYADSKYALLGYNDVRFGYSLSTWGELSPQDIFYVSGAGTYTYYLNGYRGYLSGNARIYYPQLLLTYIPTSYGTVQASIPASQVSEFTSPELLNSDQIEGIPTPIENNEQYYKVDLRELEIKALKARAEAERAERELLEAQHKMQQPSGYEPH